MKTAIWIGIALLLLPASAWARWGDDESKTSALTTSETCTECHDDMLEPLAPTAHHPAFGVSCQDCHGTTEEHLDDPTVDNILTPLGKTGAESCIKCHADESGFHAVTGTGHGRAEVFCSDCHLAHKEPAEDAPLLVDKIDKLCLSCHQETRAQVNKPFNHGMGHGGVNCADCHNPHGGTGKDSLKHAGATDEPCLNCHTEKQGPFVFEHVNGLAGDCSTCHEPHGSFNSQLLIRADVSQLCLECHSSDPAGFLGSQPPSRHNLTTPRYRDCTACHTAVHGSSRSALLLK